MSVFTAASAPSTTGASSCSAEAGLVSAFHVLLANFTRVIVLGGPAVELGLVLAVLLGLGTGLLHGAAKKAVMAHEGAGQELEGVRFCAAALGVPLELALGPFATLDLVPADVLVVGTGAMLGERGLLSWWRVISAKARQLLVLYEGAAPASGGLAGRPRRLRTAARLVASGGHWRLQRGPRLEKRVVVFERLRVIESGTPTILHMPHGTSRQLLAGNLTDATLDAIFRAAFDDARAFWFNARPPRPAHIGVTVSDFRGCRSTYTELTVLAAGFVKQAAEKHGAFPNGVTMHVSIFPFEMRLISSLLPKGPGQVGQSGYPVCIFEPDSKFPCGVSAGLSLSPWIPRCCAGGQCHSRTARSHYEPSLASHDLTTTYLPELALLVVLDSIALDSCPDPPDWLPLKNRHHTGGCPEAVDLDLGYWGFGRRLIMSYWVKLGDLAAPGAWHSAEVGRLSGPVAITFKDFRGCLSNYWHLILNAAIPMFHLFLYTSVRRLYLPTFGITWGQDEDNPTVRLLRALFPTKKLHFVDWVPFCCLPLCSPHRSVVPPALRGLPIVELSSNYLDGEPFDAEAEGGEQDPELLSIMQQVVPSFSSYVLRKHAAPPSGEPHTLALVERKMGGDRVKVSGAACRSVANHAELAEATAALAARFGLRFAPLVLEQRTLADQVAAFRAARAVVAQFGAALTNCLWSPLSTLFFELSTGAEEKDGLQWLCGSVRQGRYYRRADLATLRRTGVHSVFPQCGFEAVVDVEGVVAWVSSYLEEAGPLA